MQAEPQAGRALALARGGFRRGDERRRDDAHRLGREHRVEALAGQQVADGRPGLELARQRVGRDPLGGPGAVAGAALGRRGVERDGDARQPVPAGRGEPAAPALGVQAERVDHGGEPARQPLADDVVEQGERVGARGDVVLAGADERAQAVAGHDRVRPGSWPPPRWTCRRRPGPRARPRTGQAGDARGSVSPRSWTSTCQAVVTSKIAESGHFEDQACSWRGRPGGRTRRSVSPRPGRSGVPATGPCPRSATFPTRP